MKVFKVKDAANYLGISVSTLKTLGISSFKTSGGHRRYFKKDLDAYTGIRKGIIIGYVRCVSWIDFQRQYDIVAERTDNILYDIGSDIEVNREGLNKLLNRVMDNEINEIIVENKSRLANIGYSYLENIFNYYDVKVTEINCDKVYLDEEAATVIDILNNYSTTLFRKKRGNLLGYRDTKYLL